MNWDIVKGNWKQFSGQAQQQWGKLTDDELQQIDGRKSELEGKLQEKYGWTREQASENVDDWLSTQGAS